MAASLSDESVRTLLRDAAVIAARTCKQMGLASHHGEDIGQELLLDLLVRMPHYRPDRGSLAAFANVVFVHKAGRVAAGIRRERASLGLSLSIDDSLEGGGSSFRDILPESCGYEAMLGQRTDAASQTELRLSVRSGLDVLSSQQRRLCAALAELTVAELAQRGLGRRSTLYRRLASIRLDLLARGIGDATLAGGAQ